MRRSPRTYPRPTQAEIRIVARATVDTLTKQGLKCCLFGSAASELYGASRVPNDVDVIVLNRPNSWDVEEVKRLLTRQHHSFFLVPSTNPRNTYQVLWYRLSFLRACKVDVLLPGTLDIPQIPIPRIIYTPTDDQIPVVPYVVLVLLKLKGWDDHRNHHRQDMIVKQYVDVADINQLLGMIGDREKDRLATEEWLPKDFVGRSLLRVLQYVDKFPSSKDGWRTVGFNI